MAARKCLEQLPVDAIERIVSYLSVSDLSICCSINKAWRQIFSDDIFWKNHCVIEHSNYLETATSHVKPEFVTPQAETSSLTPVEGWRLRFLREQHLWKNWRAGRFVREEIEFDFDDTISYNIKVECVNNDFVFLHYTFETEVFDVSKKPVSIMRLPFKLNAMWENNLYKAVGGDKLIVIQCNAVQVFDINLVTKNSSFDKAFFFDKPEEFSSKITADTDIDEMYQNSSSHIGDDVERVICGDLLVGIVTEKGALSTPTLHIWNWRTGKKLKEENCVEQFGNNLRNMSIETSETTPYQEIVLQSRNMRIRRFAVYSLDTFKFLAVDEVENENSLLFGRHLAVYMGYDVRFFKLKNDGTVTSSNVSFQFQRIDCWHAINNKVLIGNRNEITLVDPLNGTVDCKIQLDYAVSDFKIMQNRFVFFHDRDEAVREVWEAGKEFKKLFSLPESGEICRAGNSVCSKVVLEFSNKLIVMNFW